MYPKPPEQWNLTPSEADALDAVIEHGRVERAAKALNLSMSSLQTYCGRIRSKAGADNLLAVAVAWDRYSRKAAV
jgi:DNA-binding CsgD family transcriptional regulator